MARGLGLVVCLLAAKAALALPPACQEIEALDLSGGSRDFARLGSLRAQCERALAESKSARILQAVQQLQLSVELTAIHAIRIQQRGRIVARQRAIVDSFRTKGSGALVQLQDSAFATALDAIDAVEADAKKARQIAFGSMLSDTVRLILNTPTDASSEVQALAATVSTKVSSAAAASDMQVTLIDSSLDIAVVQARASIKRLRTGSLLVKDQKNLEDLVGSVSEAKIEVRSTVAFERFYAAIKASLILQQTASSLNAGALSSAQARINYLRNAYAQFSETLPEPMRKAIDAKNALSMFKRLSALQQQLDAMPAAEAEDRLAAAVKYRAQGFEKQKAACAARLTGLAEPLQKLSTDLANLPEAAGRIAELPVRIFVYQTLLDQLEVFRSACEVEA